jgi:outer membrane protein assembly factor BamB
MFSNKIFATGLLILGVSSAFAVDGPMPLSWRWFAKTSFPPATQPVVSGDVVVAAVGRQVYGLDAATGAQKWMFPATNPANGDFSSSPVAMGETVLVGNTNHFVYAINRNTGNTVWSFSLGQTNARNLVAGDNLLFVFTGDDHIVALDPANGSKAWAKDYDVGANVVGEPIFAAGKLIFFTSNSKLIGLDSATQRHWDVPVQSANIEGGPVLLGQSVYVISGSQVAQLNPVTGRSGWVASFPETLAAGPGVSEKGGVVVTENGNVYTFDLTGRNISKEPIKLDGYVSGSPQAAGGSVFVRLRSGSLVLIDPSRKTDQIVWEYTTQAMPGVMRKTSDGKTESIDFVSILGPLAIGNGSVYGLAEDGSLFAWGGAFGVDEIGPSISMLSPQMGTTMWGQPDTDFWFKVEDPQTGVMSKSIHVTMNGAEMKYDYKRGSGGVFARIRQPGSTEPGANAPLSDGRKTIVVSASDWAGNVTEKTFMVTIDNTVFDKPESPPTQGGGSGGGRGPVKGGGGGTGR